MIGIRIGVNRYRYAKSEWLNKMLSSYLTIHNHATWTDDQKAAITDRLSEEYIINTFGPTGLNKTVCDFFIFLENNNTTTALTTRTNTKTGSTLRWNYGNGNIYNQNDLPAQINSGVITVTSEDGFDGWTSFNIYSNNFIGNCPNISVFPNLSSYLIFTNLLLNGNITNWTFPNTLTSIQFHFTNLTGSLVNKTIPSGLRILYAHSTSVSGDISNLTIPNACINFRVDNTLVSGNTPQIINTGQTSNCSYYFSNCNITGNGTSTFRKALTIYTIANNTWTQLELDELFANMDSWYTGSNLMTQNCTITATGANMPIPTGGSSNINIISLLSKATTAGVLWTININT